MADARQHAQTRGLHLFFKPLRKQKTGLERFTPTTCNGGNLYRSVSVFIKHQWRGSSAGKSVGFITRRPRVQVPPAPLPTASRVPSRLAPVPARDFLWAARVDHASTPRPFTDEALKRSPHALSRRPRAFTVVRRGLVPSGLLQRCASLRDERFLHVRRHGFVCAEARHM